MIKGLHHDAYRCLGIPRKRERFTRTSLGFRYERRSVAINETRSGRQTKVPAHVLPYGRRLVPGVSSRRRTCRSSSSPSMNSISASRWRMTPEVLKTILQPKGRPPGLKNARPLGSSVYPFDLLRDPNRYVIELTAKRPGHDAAIDPDHDEARRIVRRWTAERAGRLRA